MKFMLELTDADGELIFATTLDDDRPENDIGDVLWGEMKEHVRQLKEKRECVDRSVDHIVAGPVEGVNLLDGGRKSWKS